MPGSPGGLARVDDILGTNMYKSTFTASPLVFGAFPSLHSACAWQLAFFLVYIFGPRSIPFVVGYVFWIWWATMYLGHHYVVDLVGGAGYAVVAFWIGSFFLPSVLPSVHHNTKASHVIHDLGDAMNQQEKQTLFDAAHNDDDFVGFKQDKEWDLGQDEDESEIEEMATVVVVSVEPEMEERPLSHSAPASPTTGPKKNASNRQSWNGWQGYESWMEVLVTVNSPRPSPRNSPANSPRNSSSHSSGYGGKSRRHSRDSMHSVTTLNLDVEANAALVQSALATITEDGGQGSSSMPKGRARPSRLNLDQSSGSSSTSGSAPTSPATPETDAESSHSGSSRPSSPRSFVSGSSSPALGKRFKDD